MKEAKFHIGDLVSPTYKAFERNSEFLPDKVYIVTSVDRGLWEDDCIWCNLADKDSEESYFCLPEEEIILVRKFSWSI